MGSSGRADRLSFSVVGIVPGAVGRRSKTYLEWTTNANEERLHPMALQWISTSWDELDRAGKFEVECCGKPDESGRRPCCGCRFTKCRSCQCRMAILRAYTKDVEQEEYSQGKRALYHHVNTALVGDSVEGFTNWGSYARAMKVALWQECNYGMPNAISAGPPVEGAEPRVVERKMNLDQNILEDYTVGFTFLWPNFVSTSMGEGAYDGRDDYGPMNVLFKIELDSPHNQGTSFLYDMSSISAFAEEREVLFYPYSGFRVTNREVRGDLTVITLCTVDMRSVEGNSCGVWNGHLPLDEIEAYRQAPASQQAAQVTAASESAALAGEVSGAQVSPAASGAEEQATLPAFNMEAFWSEHWEKAWTMGTHQGNGKVRNLSLLDYADLIQPMLMAKASMRGTGEQREALLEGCMEAGVGRQDFARSNFEGFTKEALMTFYAYIESEEKVKILVNLPKHAKMKMWKRMTKDDRRALFFDRGLCPAWAI